MMRTEHIEKHFGEKHVLRDVSLEVEAGRTPAG